ncbi:MAG: LppX_LprAFG lipoprotein, partial [Frankiaceae bacterium]
MPLRRAGASWLALALLLVGLLSGCSGGSKQETAADLLARAKTSLDGTKSVHFTLTSQGAPTTGTSLLGGDGDIARPSSFQGTLKVRATGATVDLKVISVNGKVYAQLPFTTSYSVVDPASFGFGDPGKLLDPGTGVSQFLAKAQNAALGDEKRV